MQLVQEIAIPATSTSKEMLAPLATALGAPTLPPAVLLTLYPASTVHACYLAVLQALHDSLAPSTCFTLLGAAYRLDAPCLFGAARAMCVAHVTTAQQLDAQGLASLPLPVLKPLLRDQGLRVCCFKGFGGPSCTWRHVPSMHIAAVAV